MKLRLKAAKVVQLAKYPGDEETTQVLVVSALLTPPIAEQLRCRETCYTEDGVPRKFESYALALSIDGADVLLGDLSARANLLHKFKIGRPKAAADNDVSLEIRCRMHFDGSVLLSDWLDGVNKGEFELRINARQEELNFDGDDSEEEEEESEPAEAGTVAPAATMGGTHQGKRGRRAERIDALVDETHGITQ